MLTLLSLACAHPTPPAPAAAPSPLACPAGTLSGGHPPPAGTEIWCQRPVPGGFVREGPAIEYHPDGAVHGHGAYTDGKRTGAWEWNYPTGLLEKRGSYTLGQQDGEWNSWYPDGTLQSRGVYVSGREQGPWETFDLEAGIRSAGEYQLGKRVGTWVLTDRIGRTLREEDYVDGRLVAVREQ